MRVFDGQYDLAIALTASAIGKFSPRATFLQILNGAIA